MRWLALSLTLSLTACTDKVADSASAGCLCWGLIVTPLEITESEAVHTWLIDGGHDCGQELPTNLEETYFVCEEDYTSAAECEAGAVESVENAKSIRDLDVEAECVCLCET